jgi:hypothetical protein
MQPRFNFSQFYENEQLSDVLLLVRIDGDVKQRIPGHGIVLANGACFGLLFMMITSSTHGTASLTCRGAAQPHFGPCFSLAKDLHSCCSLLLELLALTYAAPALALQ